MHGEIDLFQQIPTVQTVLKAIRRLTGLGVALVSRVDRDRWTAVAVDDGAGTGVRPGDALPRDLTY